MRRRVSALGVVFFLLFSLAGCRFLPWVNPGQKGLASWYGNEYNGRATASGEIFDENLMTAAHRDYPFGTIVRVVNLRNGRDVIVRINDRGPFIRGRIIDVSKGAARELGMLVDGVVPVRVEVLRWGRRAD